MEAPSNLATEAIASILGDNEEELLAQLAESELGEGVGLSVEDFGRLVLAGRRWLEVNRQQLWDLICASPELELARQLVGSDDGVLAAAVTDVLLGAYSLPTAATASLLLVRRGLSSLCSTC